MSSARVRRARPKDHGIEGLTLHEALQRVDEPFLADSLSVFFAHLARFQREGDEEGVHEARRAIAEAMRGVPDGPIDMPLLPALRERDKKRRR